MNKMKTLLLVILFSSATRMVTAQTNLPPLDKSPMDMCYYPVDYPILKIQHKSDAPLISRVIYGRPQKNARSIFGDLVPYDMIWRVGANEATEIEFYRDVKIAGKKLAKGRYSLYAIPSAEKWTIILNKETDTWGAFKYDQYKDKDVLQVTVPVKMLSTPVEQLTIAAPGKDLTIAWDKTKVSVPMSF